eukprot:g14961.t1
MRHQGGDAVESVPARPREELNNLAKNIADCTELHLARRGITHLTDEMEAFESLEVLWVNDNSLSRISNLDYNPTIKSLYAHNNHIGTLKVRYRIGTLKVRYRIGTLKGSLLTFTFLHTLTLGNNRIGNLQASLEILRLMRHLRYLELSGNPLAEETGYRLLVIKALPWLETLDMHKELSRMTVIVKQRRILLKEWFVAEDARREEVVTQRLFTKCLRLHGLWPSLDPDAANVLPRHQHPPPIGNDSADDKVFLAGKTGLIGGILLEAFRVPAPRRAVALGRDPAYLEQSFVDYVKFCGAVEPKTGGRDLDNQRRVLDKAWKLKPKESASKMNPLSGGAPSGQQHQIRHPLSGRSSDGGDLGGGREHTKSERARGDTAMALSTRSPMACEFTKSHTAGGPGQLDHWERVELKRILEAQGGGGGGIGSNTPPTKQVLTRTEAFTGIKKMITRGRRPRVFVVEVPLPSDEDSINNLSGSGNGGSSVAATTDGSGPTNLDIIFDAAAALSSSLLPPAASHGGGGGSGGRNGAKATSGNGGGGGAGGEGQDARELKADVGMLLRTMEEGVPAAGGGVGPLEWDWLSCEEAAGRARKLYREAAHAQRRLLLISDDDDEAVRQEASRIRSKIATSTRHAARLEALAPSSSPPLSSSSLHPSDVGHNGTGRSRGGFSPFPPSPQLGRVDVFLASDFHGGPFREHEGRSNNPHEDNNHAVAPASTSQSGCDLSLGSMSLVPTERGTIAGGAAATCDRVVEGAERPWFSKRVLTAG